MNKLSPCPFCGGEAVSGVMLRYNHFIRCKGCRIQTGYYATKEQVIAAWNRRSGWISVDKPPTEEEARHDILLCEAPYEGKRIGFYDYENKRFVI